MQIIGIFTFFPVFKKKSFSPTYLVAVEREYIAEEGPYRQSLLGDSLRSVPAATESLQPLRHTATPSDSSTSAGPLHHTRNLECPNQTTMRPSASPGHSPAFQNLLHSPL